jgi:tRNA/rRNA methyltransferase
LIGLGRDSHAVERDPFSRFAVAVVEPEYPMNLGYTARTMANFGLNQLYVISPSKKLLRHPEAMKFASHGHDIVENAKFTQSLDVLRNHFKLLVGTTAIRGKRKSNITRKTLALEESIPKILDSYARSTTRHELDSSKKQEKGLCFVFGRDTTGLTNDELRKCDYNVTIITGTRYNTLNISHAAAIIFYAFREYLRHHRIFHKVETLGERKPTRKEKDRVVTLFQELALVSGFQRFKEEKLAETLYRVLNRGDPSLRELYLLMGLASKAQAKIRYLSNYSR